jgi:dipeptidyl aminopeptidase/acylaminoacyl peptidase
VYGYVLKPANFTEGKKYPVAFLIHGGPQGSFGESWSYRWNPQTYAGQGFAVVMIDFHGSTGYGQAFTDAINEHWGDRPLEDLQKGLAFALGKYPFLDAENVAALGASYGGFMINWIAGRVERTLQSLVSHCGIFDTRMMGYATEELWFTDWENGGSVFTKPGQLRHLQPHAPCGQVARAHAGGARRQGFPRAAGPRASAPSPPARPRVLRASTCASR